MKYSIKKMSGFTLVELMITVLLSLMITFGISKILITSNQSASASDGLSQAQETGRFVMSFLASHIREAGLDQTTGIDPITTVPFIDCDTYPALENYGGGSGDDACSNHTTGGATAAVFNGGDHLAVAAVADQNTILDCTGVGGYAEGDVILNVFWVQPPTLVDPANPLSVGTPGSLWCQGFTFNNSTINALNAAQSIANGIDAMHILYGEALTNLSGDDELRNVTQYVTADDVTRWDRVYSVRIAILSSAVAGSGDNDISQYQLLDSDLYTINDNITRQIFSTTFVIKNYK
jgi:type IV pilus assembly protein PilW